ncbi:MAG TPA: TetR/AcrR family transcriptional regulator [Acidimicrobiales bacterium]|nr:TetR/AcrR family transcriptional regulator [Acidimicrobiales bacterium]
MPNERMTGTQRRAQLLDVGRSVFAERGYDGASIEDIADRAGVSKPVVYEHFGGKEGLYAVVVDREMSRLLDSMVASLSGRHPRVLLEQAAMALLQYVEEHSDGFTILIRESPVASTTGNFVSLIHDVVDKLEPIVAGMLKSRGFDPRLSPIYANALAGMVVLTGQWWLDARKPKRDVVAAHLVNLAWNGLAGLDPKPILRTQRRSRS